MANETIYPYGEGGSAASGLGIVNNLTTGGVNKALSAEQGKVLAGMIGGGGGISADIKLTYPVGLYSLSTSGEQTSQYPTNTNSGTGSAIRGILGFIPLYGASSIKCTQCLQYTGIICFYDEDYTFISYTAGPNEINVPSGAVYAKVKLGVVDVTTADVYLYGVTIDVPTILTEHEREIMLLKPRPLEGKKVAFLGDSITCNTSHGLYTRLFTERTGATVTNYAVAGQCYANNEITAEVANLTGNEDVVIMMGGTNDFLQGKVIGNAYVENNGTISKNVTTAETCGGLHAAIEAIYAKCPTAQVIIVTPPQIEMGWTIQHSGGGYLFEYVNAIKQVAQLYGIPVIDQFANCGINPKLAGMKSKYFNTDGKHPNILYHHYLAEWLYAAIADWIKDPFA